MNMQMCTSWYSIDCVPYRVLTEQHSWHSPSMNMNMTAGAHGSASESTLGSVIWACCLKSSDTFRLRSPNVTISSSL